MALKIIGQGSVKLNHVAQGRRELWAVVNTVMKLRVP